MNFVLTCQASHGHPWCVELRNINVPWGRQFHLLPRPWLLPGKESWGPDNIRAGSLQKLCRIIASVSRVCNNLKLLYQSPVIGPVSLAALFIGLLVQGAYLDAGYKPLHVLLGHLAMTHPLITS